MKCYSELVKLKTFDERLKYLQISGGVGNETFGNERYLNQIFYKSPEWKRIRDIVIIRDSACDLGIEGLELGGRVYVHHMNPLRAQDILNRTEILLNPEYLISCSKETHDAIHYGFVAEGIQVVERTKGDTKLW